MANFKHSIRFYLQQTKDKSKETPLRCFVLYDNRQAVFSTGQSIEPRYWNPKERKPRQTVAINWQKIDRELDSIADWTRRIFEAYTAKYDAYPEPAKLVELCLIAIKTKGESVAPDEKPTDFIAFAKLIADETETGQRRILNGPKKGQRYAKRTVTSYRNTIRVLEGFMKDKGRKAIHFNSVDLDLYQDLKDYLFAEKGFSDNYFTQHVKNIKTFMNEGLDRELHTNQKHKSKRFIKLPHEADTVYLDSAKLETLQGLDLTDNPRLDRVRDLFLIGCWVGLRFGDLSSIPANSIDLDSGMIELKTGKTGERVAIPLHDTVREIMKKYEGLTANSMPPVISNQNLNYYIKELCQKAGFTETVETTVTRGGRKITVKKPFYELVTVHTTRRSFASNMYRMGVPSMVIGSVTGHRSEKSFLTYIRLSATEKAEMMREIWNRNSLKAVAGGTNND